MAYTYDPVGNRLTRISSVAGVPSTTNTFDLNDRLGSDTYDANGNTLQGTVIDPIVGTLSQVADQYDFEDRLIDHQNGQVRIVYDGDGNRVSKTVGTGTNAVTTYFLVDDVNPTGYAQILEELRSPNPADGTSTPVVTRVFTYGLQRISQDQLLSNQWSASFFGYDGSGSVRYLTDMTGQITDTFDYDAFGNLLARTGTTPTKFLYRGEEYDSDLKLYYLRARYYNPHSGRFWTQDTFEGFSEDPASLHKYTYAQNDAVNMWDPSGHFGVAESVITTQLSVLATKMVAQVRSGVNHFMMGLRGQDPAPEDLAEMTLIDSMAQGAGKAFGESYFWKVIQGAAFLFNYNPYLAVTPCGDHSFNAFTGGWQTATGRVEFWALRAEFSPDPTGIIWTGAFAEFHTETECGTVTESTNQISSWFRARKPEIRQFLASAAQVGKTTAKAAAQTFDAVWNFTVAVLFTPNPEGATAQQRQALGQLAVDTFGSPLRRLGAYEPTKITSSLVEELPRDLSGPGQDLLLAYSAVAPKVGGTPPRAPELQWGAPLEPQILKPLPTEFLPLAERPDRLLTFPSQGKQNAVNGNAFQAKVFEALRLPENTLKVTGMVRGKPVNTEPDLLGLRTGVTDVKDVLELSFSTQLKAQFDYARTMGMPFNLIISPRTETVSVPLQKIIGGSGGKIFIFEPETGTFREATFNKNRVL